MGVLRGAAHRAGEAGGEGGGDYARLLVQKRLVLGVVDLPQMGGPGLRCQIRVLQLRQLRLLGVQGVNIS